MKLYEKYRLQSEGRRNSDASPEVEMEDSYTKTPSLANANRNHDDADQRLDLESLATNYPTTQTTAANDFTPQPNLPLFRILGTVQPTP